MDGGKYKTFDEWSIGENQGDNKKFTSEARSTCDMLVQDGASFFDADPDTGIIRVRRGLEEVWEVLTNGAMTKCGDVLMVTGRYPYCVCVGDVEYRSVMTGEMYVFRPGRFKVQGGG